MKTFFCTLGVVSLVLSAASFAANPRQACRAEINSFCSDVQPGGGRIIRCLQQHSKDLSDKCSAALQNVPARGQEQQQEQEQGQERGPQGMAINTFRVPLAKLNSPYTATLGVVAGVAPYSWSVTGLPPGLSANAAGAISGTPTALGSFTLNLSVKDSSKPPATASTSTILVVYDGSLAGSIGQNFFGLNLRDFSGEHGVPRVGVDQSPFGVGRLWDTHTMWLDLEPSANNFNFAASAANSMDDFIAYAQANGVTVLYALGQTPAWASSAPNDSSCKYAPGACDAPSDWNRGDNLFKTYVTTLLKRYNSSATSSNPQTGCPATNPQCHGVIGMYELWNEPSVPSEWNPNQNNSMAAFIRITNDAYDLIRSLDPNAKIVSPSGYLPWMDTSYWASGGIGAPNNSSRHFDYIAIHEYAYVGKRASFVPEQAIGDDERWRRALNKYGIRTPMANTEGSWGAKKPGNVQTDAQKQAYAARYILLDAGLLHQMTTWYTWNGSLWDPANAALQPAGEAFRHVGDWLLGAKVTSAGCLNSNGRLGDFDTCGPMGGSDTYVVNLQKPSGTAQAVWYLQFANGTVNWDATSTYSVPSQFTACQNAHDGSACAIGSHMRIGAEPMLFMTSGYGLTKLPRASERK